nr:GYD domain-containing protein [candidate division Zixibacteria bacterium]
MRTFVLMVKLASANAQLVEIGAKHKERFQMGHKWIKEIEERCPKLRFKDHYALMGYWDSMHIYEAPDEETAAVVSMMTRSHGAAQVESWVALPYERILKLTDDLQCPDGKKRK